MTPQQDPVHGPENDSTDEVVLVDAAAQEEADLSDELLDATIAEIVREEAAEDKKNASGKGGTAQTAVKKEDNTDERAILRGKLLKMAPKEKLMRQEIVRELELQKVQLQAEIRLHNSNKDFHLLSITMGQLRAVFKQIKGVAEASYEVLCELWLKVVHHFV